MAAKEFICAIESLQLVACLNRHEESFEKLVRQNPKKFVGVMRRNEARLRQDFIDNAADCIRVFREFREFVEQQLLFGTIGFDPLLYNFALYPLAAVAALALSEACTVPLSRITILSQVEGGAPAGDRRRMNILQQAVRIVEEQGGSDVGCKGLWRGSKVFVAHRLAFYGIHLSAYTNFKALIQGSLRLNPVGVAFIGGGLAALTASSVLYPLDTVKTHMALQTSKEYRGAWGTYRNMICKDGGHRSLYAGLSASLLRVVPSMAVSLSVYERLSMLWDDLRPGDSLFTTTLVCGSIAGLAASLATYPLDVVQRRLQTAAAGSGGSGLVAVGRMFGEIVREEGVGGLYRGVQAHCLKTVLDHAVAYTTYEMAKVPSAFMRLVRIGDY
ncbi:unnamed protein product [Linum trigynum]|uniref:Mitochondrial carrier protein n=1 Tax=Linum trigynum TaxID=586398 RepID=A0AAV2G3T3_9ROSI